MCEFVSLFHAGHFAVTLKELWTSVSSRSRTTQIFPESLDLIDGSSGLTWT